MREGIRNEKAQDDEFYPDSTWVFSRAGEPIKSFKAEWARATKAAGVPNLRFHDLRRTAVRNLVRIHGLDRTVAKKISGHLTDAMFEQYNITDEDDILAAKQKIDAATAASDRVETVEVAELLAGIPREKLMALLSLLTPS